MKNINRILVGLLLLGVVCTCNLNLSSATTPETTAMHYIAEVTNSNGCIRALNEEYHHNNNTWSWDAVDTCTNKTIGCVWYTPSELGYHINSNLFSYEDAGMAAYEFLRANSSYDDWYVYYGADDIVYIPAWYVGVGDDVLYSYIVFAKKNRNCRDILPIQVEVLENGEYRVFDITPHY